MNLIVAALLVFNFSNDHTNLIYSCGETAEFRVKITEENGGAPTGGVLTATLDNFGPKQLGQARWNLAETNVFSISGRLDEPGFLRLRVDGKVWSVGYEPEKIAKGSPSPDDFDAFWAEARAKLARSVPLDPRVELVEERTTDAFSFYRVSFATFGRRVYGLLTVPKDRSKAPYPVLVGVNAAGFGNWTNDLAGRPDAICAQFSVYDWPMDWNWAQNGTRKRYDELDAACKAKYGTGYPCAGLAVSREEYFFYPVLLGIDRAVDWLAQNHPVDAKRFRYHGTSQGGGFGFYLCALNKHFTRAAFYVPAITDTMGYLKGRQSGWPRPCEQRDGKIGERRAALEANAPYFDAANFASRITCPVRVAVGFADTTCAPCAVYAAYNEIKSSDKGIHHGFGMTHSCFARFYAELGGWLNDD